MVLQAFTDVKFSSTNDFSNLYCCRAPHAIAWSINGSSCKVQYVKGRSRNGFSSLSNYVQQYKWLLKPFQLSSSVSKGKEQTWFLKRLQTSCLVQMAFQTFIVVKLSMLRRRLKMVQAFSDARLFSSTNGSSRLSNVEELFPLLNMPTEKT